MEMKLNANEETYEMLEICGQTVLFTSVRIDRETVPDGLYAYDLRHDDECQGDICEIKPSVAVNHWGTIICKEPIEMNELGYRPVAEEEYNYTGESMTLEDFQEEQSVNRNGDESDMKIIEIEAQQLRSMKKHEGLVIQGCGGDLKEWFDGINDLLTEADILKNGSKFEKCYVFKNENLTCMLFPFEDVQLEMGKLAMWRLQTHGQFGGTWLSDYVPNRLGGFVLEIGEYEEEMGMEMM